MKHETQIVEAALTAQELFDTIAKHLLTQGCKSVSHLPSGIGIRCVYRGEGGLKCAVGAVILDEEYTPAMEGESVGRLQEKGLLPGRLIEHEGLLKRLQLTHDHNEVRDWMEALQTAAGYYGLEWRF